MLGCVSGYSGIHSSLLRSSEQEKGSNSRGTQLREVGEPGVVGLDG